MKDIIKNIARNNTHANGSALLLSILIITALISISTTLLMIFVPKIKTSVDIKDSVGAIYAADSGIEHCLYVARIEPAATPIFINGATFTVSPADCSTPPFTSSGRLNNVTRTLEVDF